MAAGKVLVIDDEPMIRWAIERTLSSAGYEVAVAETAAEGLRLFLEVLPDVVFLDVRLDDENGFAVLKRMREEGGQGSAVIVMTAFEALYTAEDAKDLGAYAYLSKPFDFEGLETLVEQALAARPAISQSG